MDIVRGSIYNIYHSTDETVILLTDTHVYKCYNEAIRNCLQKYAKIGMTVTLHVKDNEIQSIDIKL